METVAEGYKKQDPKNRNLLLCLLMTASDLSDQTKSWDNTKHIAVSQPCLIPLLRGNWQSSACIIVYGFEEGTNQQAEQKTNTGEGGASFVFCCC